MAGEVKKIIDVIMQQRSEGNPTIAMTIETKLILKGINPEDHTSLSDDDSATIDKVMEIAAQMDVNI